MKLLIFTTVLGVCAAGLLPQTYLPPSSSGHFSAGSGSFSSGSSSFGGSSGFNSGSSSYNSGAYQGGSAGHGGAGAYQGGSGAYQGAGGYQGGSGSYQGAGGYNSGAGAYHGGSSRPQDANAQILRLNSDVNEHGFSYEYETSNGIRAHAQGEATNGVQSQGAFSYKGDDGHDYSITYTADENGYRPQGAHLPTPPPVPEEILRSLEQNARDEAAGIHDDGSYHDSGAGSHSGGGGQYSSGQYSSGGPSNQYLTPQTHRTQPSYNSQSGYHY